MNTDDKTTATAAPAPLRILGLRVSNYKRLVAVDLAPDGRSVVVGGRNAQGKSSLLDAIADALGGAKRGSKADLPLRTGSIRGEVRVDLGELVVRRTWRPGKDELVVESPPGSPIKSPQAVLDKLVGDLSFDPLGFARQATKDQAETLRRLSGLDLRDLEKKRDAAYAERTGVNAQAKRAKAVRDEIVLPEVPPVPPARPVIRDLLEKQRELRAVIEESDGREATAAEKKKALDDAVAEIASLEREGEETKTRLGFAYAAKLDLDATKRTAETALKAAEAAGVNAGTVSAVRDLVAQAQKTIEIFGQYGVKAAENLLKTKAEDLLARRAKLPEVEKAEREARIDALGAAENREASKTALAEVDRALADADAATTRADKAQRLVDAYNDAEKAWKTRDAEVQRVEADADRLTASLKELDEEKLRRIAEAKMPIADLGIDGDTVTYRGVPFAQASQAQKVLVGFAIGAALNPSLRVILVREGALLDDESLAALLSAAAERDFQVWIETVGERDASGDSFGIVIEDGRVAAAEVVS